MAPAEVGDPLGARQQALARRRQRRARLGLLAGRRERLGVGQPNHRLPLLDLAQPLERRVTPRRAAARPAVAIPAAQPGARQRAERRHLDRGRDRQRGDGRRRFFGRGREVAAGDQDLGQVDPRQPLEPRLALPPERLDGHPFEPLGLRQLGPKAEDAAEVVLHGGRQIVEPHAVAGAERLAQRSLGALEVAQLRVHVAEVVADGASVAQVARLLERLQRRLETGEAAPEIAGRRGPHRPHLVQEPQRLRIERRVPLAGQRADGRDQRIGDRVPPAEHQEVGAPGERDDSRAADGRIGRERRRLDLGDLAFDRLQPAVLARRDDRLRQRAQPGGAAGREIGGRGQGQPLGLGQLAAPDVRLGGDQAQLPGLLPGRAPGDPQLRPLDRRDQIVRAQATARPPARTSGRRATARRHGESAPPARWRPRPRPARASRPPAGGRAADPRR